MNRLRDLIYRLRSGESERRIALDLGIHRGTVRKYHQVARRLGYLEPDAPIPPELDLEAVLGSTPNPPIVASSLEPYRDTVTSLLDQGVEIAALFCRLQEDHSYNGSYSSVRRFVRRLRPNVPEVFVRVHRAPGEEAQVDFGPVGQLVDPASGNARTAYAFVATLSYSRHQYAELVFDQKVPTWIALHRRAFQSWGGVPARIVPDNLKAAVLQVLVHDVVLAEGYRRMAEHYGFLISPTRPRTPRHKGKVESGLHYLQRNFMAGQQFADIRQANERLQTWVRERAGTRDHGTTHQPPLALFAQHERAALLALPGVEFTLREIRLAKVHLDCHVTIDGSYYSAPARYCTRTLEAHVGERVVELFDGQTLVATHPRSTQRGQWMTRNEHYPTHKAAFLERTPARCRELAARVGPATFHVVDTLLSDRPLDRLRSVQGILRLQDTVTAKRLEAACARAAYYGDVRYRRIKEILNAALDAEPLPNAVPEPHRPHFAFARVATEFFATVEEASS